MNATVYYLSCFGHMGHVFIFILCCRFPDVSRSSVHLYDPDDVFYWIDGRTKKLTMHATTLWRLVASNKRIKKQ